MTRRVSVLPSLPVARAYEYTDEYTEDKALEPGDIVRIPFGPREILGVVWDAETPPRIDAAKLRAVRAKCDAPPLNEVHRRFIAWIANYTLTPLGAVLRLTLNTPDALKPPPPRFVLAPTGKTPTRMTEARARVIKAAETQPGTAAELARAARVSAGVVAGLLRAGALARRETHTREETPQQPALSKPLSQPQADAAHAIDEAFKKSGFAPFLLDGVTGSGKTEVYFNSIETALNKGGQALVLLPEIALTTHLITRFEHRFGQKPTLWHSALSRQKRARVWRAVAEGEARIILGARSALFLPFPNLGLIIVDEEHDPAFKQEDGVIYHARDMAVARASLGEFPIVLASATPALESLVNVRRGRYTQLSLPERHGAAQLPDIRAIDLRAEPPPKGRFIAEALREAVAKALGEGTQALFFLNRRGFAPLSLCRACGYRFACPHCDSWLVAHKAPESLLCHHCGHKERAAKICPSCAAEDTRAVCGPGIERIHEEARALFPDANISLLSSDIPPTAEARKAVITDMETRKTDILIGTQIVAKGYHFPHLTVAGIIDADLGLANGDLRAAERTYQLLQQVAGRAGREARAGTAFLQTWMPEHPVMAALVSGTRARFLAEEAKARRQAGLPPYGRLVALIVSGSERAETEETARALARSAPKNAAIRVLGPAPAPLSRLRGRFRFRLLVKAPGDAQLHAFMRHWQTAWQTTMPKNRRIRIAIDVDPYSFL